MTIAATMMKLVPDGASRVVLAARVSFMYFTAS
jgi:hypothetical protein